MKPANIAKLHKIAERLVMGTDLPSDEPDDYIQLVRRSKKYMVVSFTAHAEEARAAMKQMAIEITELIKDEKA